MRPVQTTEAQAQSPRLKIISAYYGVDNGPDREVSEEFLRPKIRGDALVGWVGSDLFGPLDPAIGLPKRLKVHYSFDGREATAIRPENKFLVLPEDDFLKNQAGALYNEKEELKKLLAKTSGLVLQQVQDGSFFTGSPAAIFAPLQMKAFRLASDLRNFHEEGMKSYPGDINPARESLEAVHAHSDKRISWRKRVQTGYERRFAKEVNDLILEFGEAGIQLPMSFFPPGNVKKIEDDIPYMEAAIIAMAHQVDGVTLYGRQ
jgi:hypothetical protein